MSWSNTRTQGCTLSVLEEMTWKFRQKDLLEDDVCRARSFATACNFVGNASLVMSLIDDIEYSEGGVEAHVSLEPISSETDDNLRRLFAKLAGMFWTEFVSARKIREHDGQMFESLMRRDNSWSRQTSHVESSPI